MTSFNLSNRFQANISDSLEKKYNMWHFFLALAIKAYLL